MTDAEKLAKMRECLKANLDLMEAMSAERELLLAVARAADEVAYVRRGSEGNFDEKLSALREALKNLPTGGVVQTSQS